ncbi:hypothetical protein FGB62_63g116 [Gracilaria domingensis]|nr:hypothetical protein FGB62_63g116 [Gracilaria domingensis]
MFLEEGPVILRSRKPPVPSQITAAWCTRAQHIDLLLEEDKVPEALQSADGNEFVTHGVTEDGKEHIVTIVDDSIGRAKASIFSVADGSSNGVRYRLELCAKAHSQLRVREVIRRGEQVIQSEAAKRSLRKQKY